MATHSSILAWKISWTEEPGLQSMVLQSQHDSTSKHSTAAMCWIVTNIKEKTKLEEEACVYGCGFQTECLGSPLSKKMAFEGKSE